MELTKVKDYNTGIANNLGGDAYEIEADAEFFNHLSKRIYTDSMLAIVRELTCNAWDSHVEAGNEHIPVVIQCPNTIQPVFKVIDNGLGMDIEALNNVYRKYGKSTKRNDMNQTGGLGVGSKTPFAYTDSFTVYSVKDGFKHTMINYKENGIPKIKEIITVETDEPNGVTVEVPVKVDDFKNFERRIESMANMFGGNLEIRGMDYVFEEQNIYRTMTDDYKHKLYDFEFPENMFRVPSHKAQSFTSGKFLVLMGNVPYQLDISKLNITSNAEKFLDDISSYHWVTCIQVPIGCLDFSMSREHLEYSDRTITYLENFIESMREDAREYVEECLEDATCEIDRYQKSHKIYSEYPSLYDTAPKQKRYHLITLAQKRRNFRKLNKSWSSMAGLTMVPLDRTASNNREYYFYSPEQGKIVIHLIHYSTSKLLRKKLAKAHEEGIIKYRTNDGQQVICGMMSEKQADIIQNIIETNMGENIEFLDLRRVNLDDIEVERGISSEPRSKIVARAYGGSDNTSGYSVTVGELENPESLAAMTTYVWMPSYGRDIEFESGNFMDNPRLTEDAIMLGLRKFLAKFMPSENEDGEKVKYRLAGLGKSHRRLALNYDNFVPADEFIETSSELKRGIQNAVDWCLAHHPDDTLYFILKSAYGQSEANDMLTYMGRTDRLSTWKNEYDMVKDRMHAIDFMTQLFGYKTLMQFPITAKIGRHFIVEYKAAKRKEPMTAYKMLVRERDKMDELLESYASYVTKRNNKLKFKRRKNYEEIKL